MQMEHYISELLYRYQCVTVPGFGSFITNNKAATVNSDTNTFCPPTKLISFNKQINTNDGLLAKYVAEAEKLTYEFALVKIETTVFQWQHTLKNQQVLTLNNIGEFYIGEENTLQFAPSEKVNYLTESFGLASFTSPVIVREQLKETVIKLEEKAPIRVTPEARKTPMYLKYAAIAVTTIAVAGLIGYNSYVNEKASQQQLTLKTQQEAQNKQIQEATFFDKIPLELPPVQIQVQKKTENYKYHVIAGAFRTEENAHTKVQELIDNGFKDALILGQNKYGLWQVSLKGFDNSREATGFLYKVRNAEEGAWLFVAK